MLHQPFCVPHEALLQDTSPPPPPPPAAGTAMRPSVGQRQQCHQAWVARTRCCFSNLSTTYQVLHASLLTSYKLVFLFFFLNVSFFLITSYHVRHARSMILYVHARAKITYHIKLIAPWSCSICPDYARHQVRHAPLMIWYMIEECCVLIANK